MNAIEEMRKVIDPDINYISLLKAQMTKYKSKKMVGGKWVYDYDKPGKAREKKAEPDAITLKRREILSKLNKVENIYKEKINLEAINTGESLKEKYQEKKITKNEYREGRKNLQIKRERKLNRKLKEFGISKKLFLLYKDDEGRHSQSFTSALKEAVG